LFQLAHYLLSAHSSILTEEEFT